MEGSPSVSLCRQLQQQQQAELEVHQRDGLTAYDLSQVSPVGHHHCAPPTSLFTLPVLPQGRGGILHIGNHSTFWKQSLILVCLFVFACFLNVCSDLEFLCRCPSLLCPLECMRLGRPSTKLRPCSPRRETPASPTCTPESLDVCALLCKHMMYCVILLFCKH